MKYRNLVDLFWKRAAKYRAKTFLRYKTRKSAPFETLSWDEVKEASEDIAYGLKALGINRGNNVGLLSASCHYWLICDMAILSLGAITVPLYHSSKTETVSYIVEHSDMEIIFVRNKIQLQKIRSIWDKLPKLRYAIVLIDQGDIPDNDPRILTIDDLRKIGRGERKLEMDFLSERVHDIHLDEVASIIYTSGTTGEPKGVILTHRNILTAALSFYQYVPLEEHDNMLSFLPLAHVFERVAGQFYGIDQGVVLTYCEKAEWLPQMLHEAECNILLAVPRMIEKMYESILLAVSKAGYIQKKLFDEALKIGIEYMQKKVNKEPIEAALKLKYQVAYKAVLSKVKKKLAPHVKVFVVGGAPFRIDLIYAFMAFGFSVVEGYGLTETSAPISVNPLWANKPGTVGIPFTHFEVKIADDGEILCKGAAVFKGYFKDPDTTAEALDGEGWFHTGDIGEIDLDGYLKITGRKKDILITAGGKNIAPQRIETLLLRSSCFAQVVILGDKEKYLAALVTLNNDEVKQRLAEKGVSVDKTKKLSEMDEVYALIDEEIRANSKELASYEQIKAFHILENELSIESGELTPTLKVRRNVVRARYKDIIQPLFNRQKPNA